MPTSCADSWRRWKSSRNRKTPGQLRRRRKEEDPIRIPQHGFGAVIKLALVGLSWATLYAGDGDLSRARLKLEAIKSHRIQPGFRVTFIETEVNAWVADQMAHKYEGIDSTRIRLGAGTVSATAMMDFVRMRGVEGLDTFPVLAQLLEGQRPVRLDLRVQSSGGYATVSPTRLEISSVALTGSVLERLIETLALPVFPDTEVNRPFELRKGIDRIEIVPGALRVVMKR